MGSRRLAIACLILAGCGASPEARYQEGRALMRQGKLDEAMAIAERGMRGGGSWPFRILKADVLLARADTKAARELLGLAPPPSDPELLARLRMDQAWAENLDANYSRAEALLLEAARIAAPLPPTVVQTVIEVRLGDVLAKEGRREESERALRHAVEVAGALGDLTLQATAMNNLGLLFLNAFQLEDAVYWIDKASTVFRRLGVETSYYVTLGNLGSCYQNLGDSDKALDYFEQARAYANRVHNRYDEQLWIGNSGDVLSERGDYDKALEKFKQALEIAKLRDRNERNLTGWWYYSLASTSIELGDFDAAEKYNRESLRLREAIGDHSDYYPRINEAHVAAGRKDARAEDLYRGLIAEYKPGMSPVEMLEARAGLAALLAAKGQLDQADTQFREALAALESQRAALVQADDRMTYLARLIRFYDRYIDFLVDRNQPDRALEVAEASRARVLDERLESKPARPAVSAARLRELARSSHSVFLSYWLGRKRSFLWKVSADGIVLHPLPPESQIAALVSGYRAFLENLRDPMQSEFPAGRKLAAMLVGPALPLPEPAGRVVLALEGSLHALNFETLPDPENPSRYLIERATLEVAPSLNLLGEARGAARAPDTLLLIGNPEQAVEEYPRLPFAGSEIEQISRVFHAKKKTVLQGTDAHPEAYRQARPGEYAWIHFAAHAAANRNNPLDSALILSRHAGAGYQLLARDAMNVPLNATLVTLSACRGAGARTLSGEGQVGLSWAFLRAGARSVVAGLWDVTDRSTAELMADLYDQLAHNASPAGALRHAKLTLLHGSGMYKKPFYWGPFQLYAGGL
ncbi:MAG TPA: CHAT domain-containing protein [Bryobacteraceae bacterium]|nr:CHAT domain-containing protein [Bryobacteraceae bacterium]